MVWSLIQEAVAIATHNTGADFAADDDDDNDNDDDNAVRLYSIIEDCY
jgi:hypothetical protein